MDELLLTYPKQSSAFIGEILKVVSEESKIPVDLILMKTRKREVVEFRQIAMSLSKTFTGASLATIGSMIGNKDHSTVLHACKTVNNLIDTDRSYKGSYTEMYIRIGRVIEMMPDKTKVCSICGSDQVETKAWIAVNNNRIIEEIEPDDIFNNWCPDCKEHTAIIQIADYIAAQETENIENLP